METNRVDQSDYIESAARMQSDNSTDLYVGYKSAASCRSCGGGCYGCKGSKAAEASLEGANTGLVEIIDSILD